MGSTGAVSRYVGLVVAAGLVACGSKETDTGGPGSTGTTEMDASGAPTGGAAETGGPGDHGDCEQYIDCLTVVTPDIADEAEQAYGAGSPCWTSGAARDACLMACSAGLEAVGVSYPDEPACGGMGGGSTAGTGPGTGDTTGAPVGLSFMVDVWEPILAPICTCHVGGAGGLVMGDNAEQAYAAMVGVMANGAPLAYVAAGDVSGSYLVHKLEGTQIEVGGQGSMMPLAGQLNAGQVDTIKQWIADGALP